MTPRPILTPFGRIVVGNVPRNVESAVQQLHLNHLRLDNLHESVEQFRLTESCGVRAKTLMSDDDKRAVDALNASITNIGNRYEVGLMWKDPDCKLPDNRESAWKRFVSLDIGSAATLTSQHSILR